MSIIKPVLETLTDSELSFILQVIKLWVAFDNAEDDNAQSSPMSVVKLNRMVTMKHPVGTLFSPFPGPHSYAIALSAGRVPQ